MINFLKGKTDTYRIVFYVDEGYKINSLTAATYASAEAALSFNQSPTVLIDCDEPTTALERAKVYRFYAVPAIMCCSCKSDELDTVSRVYGVQEVPSPSILTVPDFSVSNTRLMAFFLRDGSRHISDIDRLEIEVHLPANKKLNIGVWVGWARMFNAIYGTDRANVSVKGCTCYCGKVIIKVVTDEALPSNGEEIDIRLFYGSKEHLCFTFMKTFCENLVDDCLNGIEKLLEWFAVNPDEISAGKVFANHLNTVLYADKKNLP
ncbi:MAG: hypothetical protein IJ532_06230 [Alphaproteobacteria bacterium]|nr:hypothetical protein [Alphaproteobacteria bacterium]